MCGIVGIAAVPGTNVNQDIYDALTILQHRGQDAAGMVTCLDGHFSQRKANGLVRDVFRTRHMKQLLGKLKKPSKKMLILSMLVVRQVLAQLISKKKRLKDNERIIRIINNNFISYFSLLRTFYYNLELKLYF